MKKIIILVGIVFLIGLSNFVIAEDAIQAGIDASGISNATVYNNQKVVVRDLDNNQVIMTFDKFVVKGNQRWAFRYKTAIDSFISELFNIPGVLYAIEYTDMAFQEVKDSVRALINETMS